MLDELTPDLYDPLLLADVVLPSFSEAAGLEKGALKITYDPTLKKRQLRIKATEGAAYDNENAQEQIADMIENIDHAMAPFHVAFLKADVRRPAMRPWPLDLMMTVTNLQLCYLHAQTCRSLIGETLEVVLSVTLPKGGGTPLRAQIDCYLPGEGKAEPAQTAALRGYCAVAKGFWDRLAATAIGHWCRDNGISELRLAGRIRVNPRQAAFALSQSVEDPTPETMH